MLILKMSFVCPFSFVHFNSKRLFDVETKFGALVWIEPVHSIFQVFVQGTHVSNKVSFVI